MDCKKCYWFGQCESSDSCPDYTPLTDELEIAAYQEDLSMRKSNDEEIISSLK